MPTWQIIITVKQEDEIHVLNEYSGVIPHQHVLRVLIFFTEYDGVKVRAIPMDDAKDEQRVFTEYDAFMEWLSDEKSCRSKRRKLNDDES